MENMPSVLQQRPDQERRGPLEALSDAELLTEVARLARREREAVADLVLSLGELDARKLYLKDGCASLFTYCTERLHLSEHAAYRRIEAARLARRFPLVLERLREGALTLTAAGLLGPHLTEANCHSVLDAARHKSKRAVEELVARLHPQPDVPTSFRRLPEPRAVVVVAQADMLGEPRSLGAEAGTDTSRVGNTSPALPTHAADRVAPTLSSAPPEASVLRRGPRRAEIHPLSTTRYSLHVTLSADTHKKLRQAQALLRHVVPTGDPAEVIDRALTLLVAHLERQKHAAVGSTGRRKRVSPHVGTGAERGAAGGAAAATAARGGGSTSAPHRRRPSRYIPAAVRRAVWERDQGQCTFVGEGGHRCTERAFLEFHHRVPFADGGASTVENVALACRVHNAYEADRFAPLTAREPCVAYQLCPDRVHTSPRMAPPHRRGRRSGSSSVLGHGFHTEVRPAGNVRKPERYARMA